MWKQFCKIKKNTPDMASVRPGRPPCAASRGPRSSRRPTASPPMGPRPSRRPTAYPLRRSPGQASPPPCPSLPCRGPRRDRGWRRLTPATRAKSWRRRSEFGILARRVRPNPALDHAGEGRTSHPCRRGAATTPERGPRPRPRRRGPPPARPQIHAGEGLRDPLAHPRPAVYRPIADLHARSAPTARHRDGPPPNCVREDLCRRERERERGGVMVRRDWRGDSICVGRGGGSVGDEGPGECRGRRLCG
uniref:Uncharacterized protein n=1 Tax=Arundo donax TaxID=35708 RepID=A0A0A9D1M4_ARUDO